MTFFFLIGVNIPSSDLSAIEIFYVEASEIDFDPEFLYCFFKLAVDGKISFAAPNPSDKIDHRNNNIEIIRRQPSFHPNSPIKPCVIAIFGN